MSFGFDPKKLRERMAKQEEQKSGGGKKKKDPRFLNYYELPENGTIHVRFLPATPDGDPWVSWKQHGSKLKGTQAIRCSYESTGDSCPVCQHSWELYEAGDKENNKLWIGDEKFLAQVIVESSDIEIPVAEDGNPIKIMYLPVKIKETIFDAIMNGIVEDPLDRVFVIKKTKNAGGFASYEKSFFKGKDTPVPEEVLDVIEEGQYEPYDLTQEVPKATTEDDMLEWFEEAKEKLNKPKQEPKQEQKTAPKQESAPAKDAEPEPDQEPEKKVSASSALDRLRNRRRS